jgi:hypothetical protein
MADELRYTYKNIDKAQLESKLDEFWGGLQQYLDLAAEARAQGVDLEKLHGKPRGEVITVRKEGEGFDPVTTALVVAFAPVAAKVTRDLWEKFVLPRILRDKGQDALTPKK